MKMDFNYGLNHYFLRSNLLNLPLHTIFFGQLMIESDFFILNLTCYKTELNKQTIKHSRPSSNEITNPTLDLILHELRDQLLYQKRFPKKEKTNTTFSLTRNKTRDIKD